MKKTIRTQFFLWITLHSVILFASIMLLLFAFNRHEMREHPEMAAEENQEALVLLGLVGCLLPVSLVGAWIIAQRLLQPLRQLLEPAERIGDGLLDERIEPKVATDEIGRLAGALNRAFDRHQQALERLRRFSFDASHQLRNPLAAIRTGGETCLLQARSPADYQAAIGEMLENTRRLSRTVEQLLMLADAGSGLLQRVKTNVAMAAMAETVVADARIVADMKAIRLVTDWPTPDILVLGAEEMLREALANLLDNALKYTPDQGTIRVSLRRDPRGRVRLTVEDSGPGIPAAQRPQIFRAFHKDPSALTEGVGLGLAIVADIAAAHGGSAGVDTSTLGGSAFWLEIPASTHPPSGATTPADGLSPSEPV